MVNRTTGKQCNNNLNMLMQQKSVIFCLGAQCAGGVFSGRWGCAHTAHLCAPAAAWRAPGRAAAACSACPAACASTRARTPATGLTCAATPYVPQQYLSLIRDEYKAIPNGFTSVQNTVTQASPLYSITDRNILVSVLTSKIKKKKHQSDAHKPVRRMIY